MAIVFIFVIIFLLVSIVLVTLVLNWPMTAGLAKVGDVIAFDTLKVGTHRTRFGKAARFFRFQN